MYEYIEKVRNKHERTKKRIAFVIALSFSLVILFIWITVTLPDIGNENKIDAVSTTKSPVTNFIDVISKSASELQKNVSEVKQVVGQMSSTTIHYYNSGSSSDTPVSSSTEKNSEALVSASTTQKTQENMIKQVKSQ